MSPTNTAGREPVLSAALCTANGIGRRQDKQRRWDMITNERQAHDMQSASTPRR